MSARGLVSALVTIACVWGIAFTAAALFLGWFA